LFAILLTYTAVELNFFALIKEILVSFYKKIWAELKEEWDIYKSSTKTMEGLAWK